jgi:hypothetical protein
MTDLDDRAARCSPVTLSNENGLNRSRACRHPHPSGCRPQRAAHDSPAPGLTMASAGIRKTSTGRYKVWWRLDDGTQGAKTFDARIMAREFKNELLAQVAADSWTDPRRGRILFDEWADHWWQLWSSSPRRSPRAWRRRKVTCAATYAPTSGPPTTAPDHPLDRAALAERPGGQAQPQRRDGLPVDPVAHPGSGPTRTPDPHQPCT